MNRGIVSVNVIIISLMLFVQMTYADESKSNNIVTEQQENKISKGSIDKPEVSSSSTLKSHTEIGASNYIQMLLGLFFIIAFIFIVAWLIKRMGTMSPSHSNNLKVVAGLNVGQREKIIVLQVMDEQLLVGVTPSNIQLLSKLENPIIDKAGSSLNGFQGKLQSAIRNFKNDAKSGGEA